MTTSSAITPSWTLRCASCQKEYMPLEVRYRCDCGGVLDVEHDFSALKITRETVDQRLASKARIDRSGVWRFRELILPVEHEFLAAKPEGNTNLYDAPACAAFAGVESLKLKHEGENPTGSFKDRGMTAGMTIARKLGMTRVACASTGNTSASMASYAKQFGMQAFVFIPEGNIAYGKLAQALAYGAKTIQIAGDFDDAMDLVEKVCNSEGIYLLNSVNPYRIEGQKAIGFELLQDLDWQVPDWIVLPGGNLGNNTAIAKGLLELHALGWIDKLPRMAVIQAHGANPLYRAFRDNTDVVAVPNAQTIATAIKIGNPISAVKSLRGIRALNGVVEEVTDQEIVDAKAFVDAEGIGAEPASCATVAGLKKLVAAGVIAPHETICGILTGHMLKDPDLVVNYHRSQLDGLVSNFPNSPISVDATLEAVLKVVREA